MFLLASVFATCNYRSFSDNVAINTNYRNTGVSLANSDVTLMNFTSYWHLIRIKDLNISASGEDFTLTWRTHQNDNIVYNSFWGAIAISFTKYYNTNKYCTHDKKIYNIGIRDNLYENIQRENMTLIFLSNYNGTYFSQRIIFMKGAVADNMTFYDYQFQQRHKDSSNIEYYELNHTDIIATKANSLYNPSSAIYNSAKSLKNYSYHYYLLEYVFLVPTNYLPLRIREANPYNYTWAICYQYYNESTRYKHFYNETGETVTSIYEIDTLYCMYVSLNNTILEVNSIPIVSVFAGSDNAQQIPDFTFFVLTGLVATMFVGVYVLVTKKSHKKYH